MKPAELVHDQFSSPEVVEAYTKVGLYPAEAKLIERYFGRGSTVLDIGCGAGRTTIHLAEMGYRVTGIDLVPQMIAAADRQARRMNVNVQFRVMDAVKMQFRPGSFDHALFSYNGIDQVQGKRNREKVIRNVFEALKPGGCFIMTTRSGLALSRRTLVWGWLLASFTYDKLARGRGGLELGDKVWKGRYYHYINPFQMKALLRETGYELQYFNSEKRIAKEKGPTPLVNFSSDRMLFYVLRKPALDRLTVVRLARA